MGPDYEQMLIDVKGIGPVTAQEIMADYPDADALKAALEEGSYTFRPRHSSR